MIVVRNCFIAKPGQAGKLAAQLKDALSVMQLTGARVLTDVTGDMNHVVLEYQAENIGEFESRMREYQTNSAFRDKMKGYTDLYLTGNRQILQVM